MGNNRVCAPVEKHSKSCFVPSTIMKMLEKFPPMNYDISPESIIFENNFRIDSSLKLGLLNRNRKAYACVVLYKLIVLRR